MSEAGETKPVQTVSVIFDCTDQEFREAEIALTGEIKSPQPKRINLLGWVLFIVLAVLVFAAMRKRAAPPVVVVSTPEAIPLDVQIAGAMFAVAVIIFAVGASLVRKVMRSSRYQWVGQLKITIDENGIRYDRPGRIMYFTWQRFVGYLETPSTLILRDQPRHGLTIPKRLFTSPLDLEFVREILRRRFVHDPKQRAFEVIPR